MLTDFNISDLTSLEIPDEDNLPTKVDNEVQQTERYTQFKKHILYIRFTEITHFISDFQSLGLDLRASQTVVYRLDQCLTEFIQQSSVFLRTYVTNSVYIYNCLTSMSSQTCLFTHQV
jgi:hypothetical protein